METVLCPSQILTKPGLVGAILAMGERKQSFRRADGGGGGGVGEAMTHPV